MQAVSKNIVAEDVPSKQSSLVTEHIQALARSLRQNGDGWSSSVSRAYGVTSCSGSEGVTTVAANLAVAVSQLDTGPVLLVDANDQRPAVGRTFGAKCQEGFANVLLGDYGAFDCVVKSPVDNLHLMLNGTGLDNRQPTYDAESIDKLLDELKRVFSLVLVDLPPANQMTTCYAIANRLDGVLLVVEAEHVDRDVARMALRQLQRIHANILGVVMNKSR